MDILGENLNPSFFTFRYPGRESKYIKEFIAHRPDILDKYIYDINISTGALLYSCKGGIGVTKERYIIEMHKYIAKKNFPRLLRETMSKNFGKKFGKWKYHALRDKFSWIEKKGSTMVECAELYCLWAASNYAHRYKKLGYNAIYFPTSVNFEGIKAAGELSRNKQLIFRKDNTFTMSESIITPEVVLYAHIPYHFSKYGCEFYWNQKTLSQIIKIINEFNELGHKVLVSMQYHKRGLEGEYANLKKSLSSYSHKVFPEVKDKKYDIELDNSEIYFYNF